MLYNCISARGYEECQDDILAAPGMAEDIRDALLEYRVGGDKALSAVVSPKLNSSADDPATGDIRPEVQADCKSQNRCSRNMSDSEFAP